MEGKMDFDGEAVEDPAANMRLGGRFTWSSFSISFSSPQMPAADTLVVLWGCNETGSGSSASAAIAGYYTGNPIITL
ncbi:hypothetical protein AAC387_Pa05g2734 [Persea americana]